MSVPKSERDISTKEFVEMYFLMYDKVTDSVEVHFRVSDIEYEQHKIYIDTNSKDLYSLCDEILKQIRLSEACAENKALQYIKERSLTLYLTKAIGLCYTLLSQYQLILRKLHVNDDDFIENIKSIINLKESLENSRDFVNEDLLKR